MKISKILSEKKFSLSFEVFPPKTLSDFESVKFASESIASLSPSFMSVTYGAGGGTSQYTLDVAKNIMQKYNVPTIAHLTCVSSSKDTVREKITNFIENGIENIMALRGNIPKEMINDDKSNWDYSHAVQLIREIKEIAPNICIGGACYPEIHPESTSQKEDILFLKEKVDAGCDFLTTQMFFDNNLFYDFLLKTRDAGIFVPIIPGIMPITNAIQLEKAINISGSFIPQKLKTLVDKFGGDNSTMKDAGIIYATDQILDLYANGITNVHVYSMNKPDVAKKIYNNVSSILGKQC